MSGSGDASNEVAGLCRGCARKVASGAKACPACGSVRLLFHPRLFELAVAHLDCDAFYAAIEKRDDPALRGRPVIVGGGKRGVVSTCCYIARGYGVRSAMPMFKALKACPSAVVVKPRMDVYAAEGRRLRDLMQTLTPLVQPVSIDEAYLDLSGTSTLHRASPAELLVRLQSSVEQEIGVTISVGLSDNRFLAKVASEADKPRGFFVLAAAEAADYLADRSVRTIPGVGHAFATRLAAQGCTTCGDLQRLGRRKLTERFGAETGGWLDDRAWGRDTSLVSTETERRSVSSETTLETDLADRAAIEDILWRLCERTADRAKSAGVDGRVVVLKLKLTDFRTLTRRVSLSRPTQLARPIFRAVRDLLAKEPAGRRYRLLGVGLMDLTDASPDTVDLADPDSLKLAKAERAADSARARFGHNAVVSGRAVKRLPIKEKKTSDG